MNCESARNRILGLADPASLPEPLRGHLEQCSACRAWHVLLVQVEVAVAAAPIPKSEGTGKRQLLAQFQAAPVASRKSKPAKPASSVVSAPKAVVQPAPPRAPLGERLARLWPAGLVAAAILVGAVSWAIFGGRSKDDQPVVKAPSDPMLEKVVSAKVKLDAAPSAAARIDVLATLARDLHDEAGALSKLTPGEEMNSLASMYRQVVQEALVPQARSLSEDERKATLPKYREQLEKAEQEANRLSAEAPVGSDRPLKEIAEAARAGRIELAKLIQGRL